MKAARLLSQVYSVMRDERLRTEARKTLSFVLWHQREDGSWPYAVGDTRTWTDNFHTGYVLDCLDQYSRNSGDSSCQESLRRGFEFYQENFFCGNGMSKYYSDAIYPIDSSAVAQSILTLARFGQVEMALRVALWSIKHMQDSTGCFYYQRHRLFTNEISYIRWTNAWMFAGLSYLLMQIKNQIIT